MTITPNGNTLTLAAAGVGGSGIWSVNGNNADYNSGSVGIGTNAPQAKFHVANGDLLVGPTGEEWIFHTRSHVAGDFLHITDQASGVPQFQRGLVLTQTGNVGIGTTGPASKLEVRGDIRLGPSGQYRATSGEENLRVIRGIMDSSGSIYAGSGFTVSHPAQGAYRITYTTPFSGEPTVTATPHFENFPGYVVI